MLVILFVGGGVAVICPMTPSTPLPTLARLRDAVPNASALKNTVTGLTVMGRTVAVAPVQAAAFYTAIVLPLVYLPLLAGGIDTARITVLLGLLMANAAALVLGHNYGG